MNNDHQTKTIKARAASMAHNGGVSRFYHTGVSKNAVRAASASDEISEAMAERDERKENANKK